MKRLVLLAGMIAVLVASTPLPAGAHGVGGREPTNVRVQLDGIDPPAPGVSARMIAFGEKVELTNGGDTEVLVLGYAGEPYLRVGPDGVFRNERSPATFINRTANPPGSVPDRYDADAPPEWAKIDDGDTAAWHDHRAHYMGQTGPFTIDLLVDGEPAAIRGDIAIVHPGPWWPWLLVVGALAAIVALLARRWWRATVLTALAFLIVGESVHIVGSWSEIASSFGGRLSAQLIPLAAVFLAIAAFARIATRDAEAAAPIALVAAVVVMVAGGISDIAVWWRSQIPSALPGSVTRALVATTFGLGIGVVVAAAMRLRPTTPADRTPPTTGPTAPRPS